MATNELRIAIITSGGEQTVREAAQARTALRGIATEAKATGAEGSAMGTRIAAGAKFAQSRAEAAAGAAKRTALPLTFLAVGAGKLALDFDESLERIRTLVGESEHQVDQWGDKLLELGPRLGKSPRELADALYFVTSSGVKAADALDVVKASAKASAIGLGETQTVADAVTSAMNAYGPKALDAAKATDVLLQTVRYGKGEPDELAAAIGRVIPVASKLKVPFSDVGASLAGLTLQGLDAAEATTALRAIFTTTLKPTDDAEKALKSVGLTAEDLRTSLAEKGTLATLQLLSERFDGNVESMARVFPNVRALVGAFNLTGKSGERNEQIFEAMAKKTDALGIAWDDLQGTPGQRVHKLFAMLEADGIKLGNKLADVVIPAAKDVMHVLNADLPTDQKFEQLGELLTNAISDAGPDVAKAAGALALAGAKGFINAWWDSPLWGKLFLGAAFIRAVGGPGVFGKIGAKVGGLVLGKMFPGTTGGTIAGGLTGLGASPAHPMWVSVVGGGVPGGGPVPTPVSEPGGVSKLGSALRTAGRITIVGAAAIEIADVANVPIDPKHAAEVQRSGYQGRYAGSALTGGADWDAMAKGAPKFAAGVHDAVMQTAALEKAVRDLRHEMEARSKGAGFAKALAADGKVASDEVDKVTDKLRELPPEARKQAAETMVGAAAAFEQQGKLPEGSADRLRKQIGESFRGLHLDSVRELQQLVTDGKGRLDDLATHGVASSKRLRDGITSNVDALARGVGQGFRKVNTLTNQELRDLGVDKVAFSVGSEIGKGFDGGKNAAGGVMNVPGFGSGDKVSLHAKVEPGEKVFVLNRHASAALDRLDRWNSQFPRFPGLQHGGLLGAGAGGVVLQPGVNMSVGDEPVIRQDLGKLSAELNKLVYVISGYRSPAHSVAVGGFANDPHTRGEAADIGVGSPLLSSMFGVSESQLRNVGLQRPFYPADPHEVNHVQLISDAGGARGPVAQAAAVKTLQRMVLSGPPGAARSIGQAALDKAVHGANALLRSKSSAFGGVPNVPTGPIQQMAHQMVSRMWGGDQWGPFSSLEMSEAGWNPEALNASSGAAGLAQALPASKYPAGAWPYQGLDSARLQLEWMMAYIRDRYGDPAGAWAFHQAHNWYQHGGVVQSYARGGLVGEVGDVKDRIDVIKASLADDQLSGRERDRLSTIKDLLDKRHLPADRRSRLQHELDELQAQRRDLSPADQRRLKQEEKGLEQKLEKLRKRLAVHREHRTHEISKTGLHPELHKKLQHADDRIKWFEEKVDHSEALAALASSPEGEDYSDAELADLLGFYGDEKSIGLLDWHVRRRDVAKEEVDAATRRLAVVEGMLSSKHGDAMPRWKKEALRQNRSNLRKFRRDAVGVVVEEQGVTGSDGLIFDTQMSIAELKGTTPTQSDDDSVRAELLQELLDEERRANAIMRSQYGVLVDFFGRAPQFGGGGVIPGAPGQPVAMIGHGRETVRTPEQEAALRGRTELKVVVEDGAVDPNKIRVIAGDVTHKALADFEAVATSSGPAVGQKRSRASGGRGVRGPGLGGFHPPRQT